MTKKQSFSASTKIGIIGAYPAHCDKAPFDDLDWELWAFGAGKFQTYPRYDLWFELHDPKTYPKYELAAKRVAGKDGYIDFVKREAVTSETFPFQKMLDQFGPYFFTTGQVTWMLAYAISLKPDVIGIWGVEAIHEYSPQRKDVHHFIQVAHDRGIKTVVPDGCTLLDKPKLYALPQA